MARERGERYERGDRALLRVCGPAVREARDPAGRFLIRQAVTSKGANLTILVRRATSQIVDEEEFVDGAFAFHDGENPLKNQCIRLIDLYLSLVSLTINVKKKFRMRYSGGFLCKG